METPAVYQTKNGSVPAKLESEESFSIKPVAQTLHRLMEEVVKQEINEKTVAAACQCAAQLSNILRVQLEYERLKLSQRKG